MPEETIGWKIYIESFFKSTFLKADEKHMFMNLERVNYLMELYKTYMPNIIMWYKQKIYSADLSEPIETNEMQLI